MYLHWHRILTYWKIKADWPLMRDTLNAPWLLTNRQFQWTGNGHSQLPLAKIGKPSPNIDLLRTSGSNRRAWTIFTVWPWPLTYDLDLKFQVNQSQGRPSHQKWRSKIKWLKQKSAHRQTDGHTDATKHTIAPATQSITINYTWQCTTDTQSVAALHSANATWRFSLYDTIR